MICVLLYKVPHSSVRESASKVRAREALEAQQKNDSYKLLSDEEEDDERNTFTQPVQVEGVLKVVFIYRCSQC